MVAIKLCEAKWCSTINRVLSEFVSVLYDSMNFKNERKGLVQSLIAITVLLLLLLLIHYFHDLSFAYIPLIILLITHLNQPLGKFMNCLYRDI